MAMRNHACESGLEVTYTISENDNTTVQQLFPSLARVSVVYSQHFVVQFRDMCNVIVILLNGGHANIAFELLQGSQGLLGLSSATFQSTSLDERDMKRQSPR